MQPPARSTLLQALRPDRSAGAIVAFCLALLLSACTSLGTLPSSKPGAAANAGAVQSAQAKAAIGNYRARAREHAVTREGVTVGAAALRDDEVDAVLGVSLAKVGVQPVWINIQNDSKHNFYLMPAFLDRDFYTAREVARLLKSKTNGKSREQVQQELVARDIKLKVKSGGAVSGFVYTNLTRGIKLLNIEMLGAPGLLRFSFARDVPGSRFDYERHDPEHVFRADQLEKVTPKGLGPALARLPCCTTNKADSGQGDPLNLAIVGSEREILVALVRSGWEFTDTIGVSSVGHMVKSFIFGGAYRTSPVSALYFSSRPQDFAMQRSRKTISQRNHLRLWITPLSVKGKPVWIGQISRDIGVKFTRHSPTFTTHVIDPNVDEAREYLLQSLVMANSIAAWGFAPGVGAAPQDAPRTNLGDDPYYTDGRRLVVFIAKTPRLIADANYLKWPKQGDY